MSAMCRVLILFFGAFSLVCPKTEPNQTDTPNAAAMYQRAAALIASSPHPMTTRLGQCGPQGCWAVSAPLSIEIRSLLQQTEPAAAMIRQAAKAESLVWPDSVENPAALIERNRITRAITGLLALRARQAFAEQQFDQALNELTTAFKVCHDAGQPPNLMAQMIESGASRAAIEVMANILPSLTKEMHLKVAISLDTLPPAPTLNEALIGEHRHGTRLAQRQTTDAVWSSAAAPIFKAYNELEPFFLELGKHSDVNPEEFNQIIDAEISKHYPTNVVVKGIAPMLKHHFLQHTMSKTRWALLNTGLRYLLEGKSAIVENQAPSSAQPINHEGTGKNFRLISRLSYRGTPISLNFGE